MFSPWRWIILFLPFVYLQFSYGWLVLDICQYQNTGYLPHITGQLRLTFVLHAVVGCDYIWTALMIDCKTTNSIICRERQNCPRMVSTLDLSRQQSYWCYFFPTHCNQLKMVSNWGWVTIYQQIFFFSNIFLMFDILLSLKIPTWIANKTRTTLLNYSY